MLKRLSNTDIFNGELLVVIRDGEAWFKVSSVADILGNTNPSKMLLDADLPEIWVWKASYEELVAVSKTHREIKWNSQGANFVNKDGLERLILTSKKLNQSKLNSALKKLNKTLLDALLSCDIKLKDFSVKIESKEFYYRDYLARVYNGKIEVKNPFGRIDILTDNYIIEVKEVKSSLGGLGQVLMYGDYYPKHIKVLALYGCKDIHKRFVKDLGKRSKKYGVEVWVLNMRKEIDILDSNYNFIPIQKDIFNN